MIISSVWLHYAHVLNHIMPHVYMYDLTFQIYNIYMCLHVPIAYTIRNSMHCVILGFSLHLDQFISSVNHTLCKTMYYLIVHCLPEGAVCGTCSTQIIPNCTFCSVSNDKSQGGISISTVGVTSENVMYVHNRYCTKMCWTSR